MAPKVARLSVETDVFPLYEIFDGISYVINHNPRGLPVRRYLELQGRFRHLTEEQIETIQQEVDLNRKMLQMKVTCSAC